MGSSTTLGGPLGTGYPDSQPKSLFQQNPWLAAGIGGSTLLGSLFPQVSSGFGTTNANTAQQFQNWQNNVSSQDANSLLNTISSLINRSNTSTTGAVTPTLSPDSARFMNQLIRQYSTLASGAPNLSPYAAQQTQQINRASQLQSEAVRNAMAARGLSTSPASGTAEANIQANRVGQITNLLQQIPLLRNQLQLQNMGAAGGFFSALPRGQVTSGTQTGENVQEGNTQQSGVSSAVQRSDTNAGGQTSSQGTQVQEQQKKEGGGLGGLFQAIGPILSLLFGG